MINNYYSIVLYQQKNIFYIIHSYSSFQLGSYNDYIFYINFLYSFYIYNEIILCLTIMFLLLILVILCN